MKSPEKINNEAPYLGPFGIESTKKPSKLHGPLLVYQNEEDKLTHASKQPNITDEENIYFSKPKPAVPIVKPFKDKYPQKGITKTPQKMNTNEDEDLDKPEFIGPFNPNFKPNSVKQESINKGKFNDKSKPNKNVPMFVTPPTDNDILNAPHQPVIKPEIYPILPNKANLPKLPQSPNQVHIHSKGSPEDILHFINQHPEIANYPSGSVLEIHNVPQGQKPSFVNPNAVSNDHPQVVPHIINQQGIGLPSIPPAIPGGHPQGINFDQILQEIHRNPNHQGNPFLTFPGHPQQFPNHDGLFISQQNGPLFNVRPHRNITQGLFNVQSI